MLLLTIAMAASVLSADGSTASAPLSAQPAAAAKVEDDDKLVCETVQVTGSRFKKRVCMTVAEKRRRDEFNARYARQRDATTGLSGDRANSMDGR